MELIQFNSIQPLFKILGKISGGDDLLQWCRDYITESTTKLFVILDIQTPIIIASLSQRRPTNHPHGGYSGEFCSYHQ